MNIIGSKKNAALVLAMLAGLSVYSLYPGKAYAQDAKSETSYPERDITLVIPFSPGSGADTFARNLINATQKHLDVSITPVNKPGGGTAVGVAYALAQPADGYTIFSQSDTLSFLIAQGNVPISADDIQAIARINADYEVLAVNANSDFQSYEEFVKYAKKNPGSIKIGGVGTNSQSSVFVAKFEKDAGIDLTYVPYDGGSKVAAAILGEAVDAVIVTSSNINSQIDSGDLRPLAISLGERAADRADVPTFKELGNDLIGENLLTRGIFGKSGIPEDRLQTLNAAFEKAVTEQSWKDYMARQRQQSVYMGYAEFDAFLKEQIKDLKAQLQ